MPSDFVISSWLADVEAATPAEKSFFPGCTLRKRARPAVEAEAALRKKQCALAPAAANMSTPPSPPQSNLNPRPRRPAKPQSLSPRKSQRLRGQDQRPVQQVAVAVEVEVEVAARPASCQPRARSTNKPAAALVNPGHNAPILSPPISSSAQYTAALDLDAAAGAVSKSITTHSQTSSKRAQTPSPRKTLRDLGMLDKPIEYVANRSRLPQETLPH
ncbi:hypothetical protein P154DRAFT_32487 [Amniculicola lignicola CBS 123094]|uniref:Uncharacterized protein n=1 Tax=Amniculicola lignicola CBS 123094 TaxID=1392246 RepID=A0A6A5W9V6_9PLEO|nr:hypothetical protein P154DRAFT_32487 [Amniculicola lignicola CBS 123094]